MANDENRQYFIVIGIAASLFIVCSIVGIVASQQREAAKEARQKAAARAEQERIAAERAAWEQSPEGIAARKREAAKAEQERKAQAAWERGAAARAAWERDAPARAAQEREAEIAWKREAFIRAYGIMTVGNTSESGVIQLLGVAGGYSVTSDHEGSYGRVRSLVWRFEGMRISATFDESNNVFNRMGDRVLISKSKAGF